MWDEPQNLRKADLDVREQLNSLERSWVIGRLVAQHGVNGALWRHGEAARLSVEYDAYVVSGAELLDLLQTCGLHARPSRIATGPLDTAAASRSRHAV
jgi:hypothetical protein